MRNIEEKIIYITTDGEELDNEQDAIDHQKVIDNEEKMSIKNDLEQMFEDYDVVIDSDLINEITSFIIDNFESN